MKTLVHIAVCAIIACMAVSCGNKADRASLVAIDSLIMHNPDSACELLAEYPADSLTTDDDRAYHALLTTIADYKAYRPATTDSVINIAVDHYDHGDAKTDKRMRSLLYKGCVKEELGDPQAAMRSYKEAQYTCPDNDNFYMGYIHFRIASLYKDYYKFQQAIEHYKTAFSLFSKTEDSLYSKSCMLNISEMYCSVNQDSAKYYIDKTIELASLNNDSSAIYSLYNSLAGLYFYKEDWQQVKSTALKVVNSSSDFKIENPDCFYLASMSYSLLGQLDSAQLFTDKLPVPLSTIDSFMYYQSLIEIAKARKDYDKVSEYKLCIDEINTSIDNHLLDDSLILMEHNVDATHSTNNSVSFWVLGLSLLSVGVILLLWLHNRRIHMLQSQELITQLQETQSKASKLIIQLEATVAQRDETLRSNQKDTENMRSKKDALLNELTASIEGSFACYSTIMTALLKQSKASTNPKNTKLASIMNDDFFAQLHLYLNLRYDNLIDKLADGDYNLSEEEINIICLDLCRFPNPIQWAYSNCDRYKSLLNKKKIIANKVNGSQTIANIPQNI